jgi:rSAM/selenodomain-associated transferase 1
MTPRRLVVFARLPVLGRVKTRLAATVGPQRALQVHRRLLARTLRVARAAQAERREFSYEAAGEPVPLRAAGIVRRLAAAGWAVVPQQGSGLGPRMADALEASLARGERAVLVGCDCPVLEPADIAAAFAALEQTDAVFLPAEDGGYTLVGLSRPLRAIFEAMPWGTDRVMAETRLRLAAEGASATMLRTVWDVDEAADLARWEQGGAGERC